MQLAIQLVFELTVKLVLPDWDVTFWLPGVTARVFAGFEAVNVAVIPIAA